MVLGDDLHGKVILLDGDIGIAFHGLHQSALDLGARIVGMVEDTELGVSALTMQVEGAVLLLVEVHAPVHELLDLLRCLAHHLLHSFTVGDIVARNHRVLYVLVEIVKLEVGDTGHTTLGKRGIRLVESRLADHTYTAFFCACHLQGIAHTGHACTYHKEIIPVYHT